MKCLFVALIFVFVGSSCAQAQVTSNILERVLNVRVNAGTPKEGTATAFTVDVDGREYLITAKHVVAGLKEHDKIDIFMNDKWKSLDVQIFRCDEPIDIAVLIPPYQLTVNFSLPTDFKFLYGQDAYFLGFPYGMQTAAAGINGPYPLAMIKRGTISGTQILDRDKKATLVFLDGYNNPGFSGGPIVYKDLNESGLVLKLAGVVSGFRPEVVPVMKEHDIALRSQAGETAKSQPWRIQKRANGTLFEYVDTTQTVALNTGIVVGFEFQPVVDLIRQHAIGPEAKDLPNNTPTPGR
jgi:hypothetical protein